MESDFTERKQISSMADVKLTPERMSGNTTRIIDNSIQLLFKGYAVILDDFHVSKLEYKHWLKSRIEKRLFFEHRIDRLGLKLKDKWQDKKYFIWLQQQ